MSARKILAHLLILSCLDGYVCAGEAPAPRIEGPAMAAAGVIDTITRLAGEHPERVELIELARSRGGRPVQLLTLSDAPADQRLRLPATLVVAGQRPGEDAGVRSALELAATLAAATDGLELELLESRVFHIVPLLAPDLLDSRLPLDVSGRLAGAPDDADGDRARDEDGAIDLDGDGLVLEMRIPDVSGEWRAEPDPLDPEDRRLLVKADPAAGKPGEFRLEVEGKDQDGDGRRAEDGEGSIDPWRSFPAFAGAPERGGGAGVSPLWEPEARALADFLLGRTEIGTAYVLGGEGDEVLVPLHAQPPGKLPDADDQRALALARRVQESAGLARVRHAHEHHSAGGTLLDWLAWELGLTAVAIEPWGLPAAERSELITRYKEGGLEGEPSEERLWLRWCTEHAPDLGFRSWQTFEHPELGAVEIGGWLATGREIPPADYLPGLGSRVARAILETCDLQPELVMEVSARRLDVRVNAVYEIRARVANVGALPTASQRAIATRRDRKVELELVAERGEVVHHLGDPRQRCGQLDPGARADEVIWVVEARPDAVLAVVATSERGGWARRQVLPVEKEPGR